MSVTLPAFESADWLSGELRKMERRGWLWTEDALLGNARITGWEARAFTKLKGIETISPQRNMLNDKL